MDFFSDNKHNKNNNNKLDYNEYLDKFRNSELDIVHSITINYETALRGATKQLNVPYYLNCENCGGIGSNKLENVKECVICKGTGIEKVKINKLFSSYFENRSCITCKGFGRVVKDPCNICLGLGKIQNFKKLSFTIPPNSKNGQIIKKIGFGHTSPKGGYDGDLIILLNIIPPK